ncbi:right-handed parallel beta-helix repeat-containing protein [Calditrichota bacterium]
MFGSLIVSILLSFVLFLPSAATAEVIHVPDDYDGISEAIYHSEDGDTVQVAAGEYVGRVRFHGKGILLLGNPENPSEVILDGEEAGYVVGFYDEEDETSILDGFTIQNGRQDYGGGIDVQTDASPIIRNCIIRDNHALTIGSGLYATHGATPTIINCIFEDNRVGDEGTVAAYDEARLVLKNCVIQNNWAYLGACAIYINDASIDMEYCLISDNEQSADAYAAVRLNLITEDVTISNCTFGPSFNENGGVVTPLSGRSDDYSVLLENCIFSSDLEIEISFDCEAFISYSNINGGEEAVFMISGDDLHWGDGNIDDDPLFADPENGYYNLRNNSPCIDAGNPDSDYDVDGSPADMGAIPYLVDGFMSGYVYAIGEGERLEGVSVSSSLRYSPFIDEFISDTTDANGYWEFGHVTSEDFSLTFSKPNYLDSVRTGLQIDFGDTLEFETGLRQAWLELSHDSLIVSVDSGGTVEAEVELSNRGNGRLSWQIEKDWRLDTPVRAWEVYESYDLNEPIGEDPFTGIAHDGEYFFISYGRHSDENPAQIYILNNEFEVVNNFDQPRLDNTRYAMSDMAVHGGFLWGYIDETIVAVNYLGELWNSWDLPDEHSFGIIRGLTYDEDNDLIWVSGWNGFWAYTTEGEFVDSLLVHGEADPGKLAYYPNDPDGYCLYELSYAAGPDYRVYKFDTQTGESILVADSIITLEESIKGFYITDQYSPYFPVAMTIISQGSTDSLKVFPLADNLHWLDLQPSVGEIAPDESQTITVTVEDVLQGVTHYPGVLKFTHNGFGGYMELPLSVYVDGLGIVYDGDWNTPLPQQLSLQAVYPNPFNAQLKIDYALPSRSDVNISLYDLNGRNVSSLSYPLQPAGRHTTVLNGIDISSGVYWLQVANGAEFDVKKVVLMK